MINAVSVWKTTFLLQNPLFYKNSLLSLQYKRWYSLSWGSVRICYNSKNY